MADIFVSYSRKNAKVVRELVRHLENQGWTVFWDRDMAAGSQFDRNLEDELNKATIVLVVWSKDSVESSWVRAEANTGLERGCLVPVRLDDSLLPLIFRSTETIDLSSWPMASRILEIRKLTLSLKTIIEADKKSEQNESDFQSVPVRDDPTLSTRVAQRVLTSLDKNTNNEQIAYQLKIEASISELALGQISGKDEDTLYHDFLSQLVSAFSAEWAILRYGDKEVAFGKVDNRSQSLSELRKSKISGVQPIDIYNPDLGFSFRSVVDNGNEIIVVMDHYPDIKQETVDRITKAFSIVSQR